MTIQYSEGLVLTLTGQQPVADQSQAQMLADVGHPASVIEREAQVTASRAQMYDQIHG